MLVRACIHLSKHEQREKINEKEWARDIQEEKQVLPSLFDPCRCSVGPTINAPLYVLETRKSNRMTPEAVGGFRGAEHMMKNLFISLLTILIGEHDKGLSQHSDGLRFLKTRVIASSLETSPEL